MADDNGILYWQLTWGSNLKGILTEEEKERCCLIRLIEPERGKAQLGVVRGETAAQISLATVVYEDDDDADHVAYDDNATWVLVHDVVAETKDAARMYLIGLHPDDGDVFFFFCHVSFYCTRRRLVCTSTRLGETVLKKLVRVYMEYRGPSILYKS
ncbi:hypothetical protein PanWU01x14_153320 [Parasponia andersonii]|uniref:Uncharacterized protein n=1 Tax=Parasponia andersonii TaxID=3476 RepID=A0A2P5CH26_PARAD|nr:hypothetical protein PanWU01x14_153320 [Parasponia andersonii]